MMCSLVTGLQTCAYPCYKGCRTKALEIQGERRLYLHSPLLRAFHDRYPCKGSDLAIRLCWRSRRSRFKLADGIVSFSTATELHSANTLCSSALLCARWPMRYRSACLPRHRCRALHIGRIEL